MARYELFAYLNKEQDFGHFQGEHGSGRVAFLRADLASQRDYLIKASKERQGGGTPHSQYRSSPVASIQQRIQHRGVRGCI